MRALFRKLLAAAALPATLAACLPENLLKPDETLHQILGLVDQPDRDDTLPLRYWLYRQRLTNRFLKTGSAAQGYSLPAARIRNPSGLDWSDATLHLGWYMGVLATEHYLIRNGRKIAIPGAPGPSVHDPLSALANAERELYFALAALDRLDRTGEAAFSAPPVCAGAAFDTPGFFIRDDVPLEFRVNGVGVHSSDYSAPFQKNIIPGIENYLVEPQVIYNKEMSQDQVYHLLLGLALTRKYMTGIVVNNTELGFFAQSLAERILRFVSADGWRIQNPACFKRVERGDDARAFAFGASLALQQIAGGGPGLNDVGHADEWFAVLPAMKIGLVVGRALEGTSYTDNLHMTMLLGALGEGWGPATAAELMQLAAINDWYAYPLVYRALHGKPPEWPFHERILRERVIPMLNSAPWEGPTSFGLTSGWRSDHRFKRNRSDQERTPEDQPTEYNGLDFLLLYNLSVIAEL